MRLVGWNWKNFRFLRGRFLCYMMLMLLFVSVCVFEVVLKILLKLLVVKIMVLDWKMCSLFVVRL